MICVLALPGENQEYHETPKNERCPEIWSKELPILFGTWNYDTVT
jgi:hypothetical protein